MAPKPPTEAAGGEGPKPSAETPKTASSPNALKLPKSRSPKEAESPKATRDRAEAGLGKSKPSLSAQAFRKTTKGPPADHPHILHVQETAKPAASLEAWFDSGLKRFASQSDDEEEQLVSGARALPRGYEGCCRGRVLVESVHTAVQIWPVRVDLSNFEADTAQPYTLYHYVHKRGFDRFAHIFGDEALASEAWALVNAVYELLQEDWRERYPHGAPPSHMNAHDEPELLVVEPEKFPAKNAIAKALWNDSPPPGTSVSKKGNKFETFVDYCIAFKLPGSACYPLGGAGTDSASTLVRVARATLEALRQRAESKRKLAEDRAAREEAARLENQARKSKGCLGFLCGGQPPEDWDEVEIREGHRKHYIDEEGNVRCDREKRGRDKYVVSLGDKFAKEHYIGMQKKNERNTRECEVQQRFEEQRRAEENADAGGTPKSARSSHCKIIVADSGPKSTRNSSGGASSGRGLWAKAAVAVAGGGGGPLSPGFMKAGKVDENALSLYRHYQRREADASEVAHTSLVRIKERSKVATPKAKGPQGTTKDEALRASTKSSAFGQAEEKAEDQQKQGEEASASSQSSRSSDEEGADNRA